MKTRESTLWTWHLIAGSVIFVLLGLHMFVMHLSGLFAAGGENVLSYSSVMERSRELAYVVIYVALLGAALYHGLYGLRNIIFELTLSERVERAISTVLVLTGILLFIVGSLATIAVYMMRGSA